VLIFIGTATRLSAARGEQRFTALRLVGATRRQISALSALESTAAGRSSSGFWHTQQRFTLRDGIGRVSWTRLRSPLRGIDPGLVSGVGRCRVRPDGGPFSTSPVTLRS